MLIIWQGYALHSIPTELPDSVKAARLLFFLNAGIWLLFGIMNLASIASNSGQRIASLVISFMLLGNAGALLAAGVGTGRRKRWFFYFGIAVLFVNILLTITDEFGVFEFITFALDVFLLGLLIGARAHYLPSDRANGGA
jgi:hypothetical protein